MVANATAADEPEQRGPADLAEAPAVGGTQRVDVTAGVPEDILIEHMFASFSITQERPARPAGRRAHDQTDTRERRRRCAGPVRPSRGAAVGRGRGGR